MKHGALLGILASQLIAGLALADVNVGVTLSATGPAASLGIPEKNTFALLPKEIAGHKGPDPARYGDWEVKGIASDFS